MDDRWARAFFSFTALAVLAGIAIQLPVSATSETGHFASPVARVFNVFAFFTIQSNLIVGATTGLLALSLRRSSTVFRVFRLAGVIGIAVTGLVYHSVLAGLFELTPWGKLTDWIVHTLVPFLGVLGWLLFGPRGLASWRVAWLSLLFPICWLAFTLIRGAVIDWYPYPFLDVNKLGYGRVAVNCLGVALLFTALAGGAVKVDQWLARRPRSAGS